MQGSELIDLSWIEGLIPNLAAYLNIQPSTVMFIWIALTVICNLTSRVIPSDAVGWKGGLRDICKIVGIHAQDRVTRGVKTIDVTRAVVESRLPSVIRAATADSEEMPEVIEDVLAAPRTPAFPGLLKSTTLKEANLEINQTGDDSYRPDMP